MSAIIFAVTGLILFSFRKEAADLIAGVIDCINRCNR
jgi:hypothetical protein